MPKSEFDRFARDYDRVLGDSIPDGLNEDSYFAEYKVAWMSKFMKNHSAPRILDFGCGAGRSLPHLETHFPEAELWGFDVSEDSLIFARERVPTAHLFSDWATVADVRFDAVIAANVFHHIRPEHRLQALKQCYKALDANGQMFLFEHNPLNPATRWIFERCPFDVDAEMLSLKSALELTKSAGFSTVRHGYTLFFPRPLAALRGLEPYLKRLPLGAQYYVQMEK